MAGLMLVFRGDTCLVFAATNSQASCNHHTPSLILSSAVVEPSSRFTNFRSCLLLYMRMFVCTLTSKHVLLKAMGWQIPSACCCRPERSHHPLAFVVSTVMKSSALGKRSGKPRNACFGILQRKRFSKLR
ncbi:hypothetical protein AUEXF2481DRAFT_411341 [Aureobasidium subglaciale EXF-2481]|uniref:Uncharacterized protein n=1 Tax=Aureobasidium subglaciale (strain EXF-2481) TaxID=1043005 RepID=A0A074Y4J8_AURSE|nr:uncharacterized protein AUEXF2481DRAFT_411341 [Aureobasidium subglaciale EXF-2481]KEQ92610.1 hypothetical protein AUEXF2481DRAFT_411341 [Aureobasidium subglaciale EXF-2481]